MLHDNRHGIRQAVQMAPEAREFGANAHSRDCMVEFAQSLADCPQVDERVGELGADSADPAGSRARAIYSDSASIQRCGAGNSRSCGHESRD